MACGKLHCTSFLWEKYGYMNMGAYVPIQWLKIYILRDIKHLHSAWVADAASFHGNWVTDGVYSQIQIVQFSANFLPTHYFNLCIVKIVLSRITLCEGCLLFSNNNNSWWIRLCSNLVANTVINTCWFTVINTCWFTDVSVAQKKHLENSVKVPFLNRSLHINNFKSL